MPRPPDPKSALPIAASNRLADLAARVRAARHADRDNPDEDAVVLR
jgi:hypothetical protein